MLVPQLMGRSLTCILPATLAHKTAKEFYLFLLLRVGFPLRFVFAIFRSSLSLIDLPFGAMRP